MSKRSGSLVWRVSGPGKTASWRAARSAVAQGFPIKNRLLWRGLEPTADDLSKMTDQCLALAREQRDWMNQKRTGRPGAQAALAGEVYFIKSGDRVKIGFSTKPTQRLSQLQTGSMEKLELVGSIKCKADRERHIHATFGRHRLHGEWFKIEGDLAIYLEGQFGLSHSPAHAAHMGSVSV